MKEIIKIGIIIADEDEFLPLEKKAAELKAQAIMMFGKKALQFNVSGNGCEALVTAILCGIGKVNAATAAAFLAANGYGIILNCGLSGGISGISRGEITVPNSFLEHDFDLTGIGYKPCEKPGQKYIYTADSKLTGILNNIVAGAKNGTAVSGDCFVSNNELRESLKNNFNAMSCDMETAAIASVCYSFGIRFAAVRKISDDAGADAAGDYQALNQLAEADLTNILLLAIQKIIAA